MISAQRRRVAALGGRGGREAERERARHRDKLGLRDTDCYLRSCARSASFASTGRGGWPGGFAAPGRRYAQVPGRFAPGAPSGVDPWAAVNPRTQFVCDGGHTCKQTLTLPKTRPQADPRGVPRPPRLRDRRLGGGPAPGRGRRARQPTFRLHRPARELAFSKQDRAAPGFEARGRGGARRPGSSRWSGSPAGAPRPSTRARSRSPGRRRRRGPVADDPRSLRADRGDRHRGAARRSASTRGSARCRASTAPAPGASTPATRRSWPGSGSG